MEAALIQQESRRAVEICVPHSQDPGSPGPISPVSQPRIRRAKEPASGAARSGGVGAASLGAKAPAEHAAAALLVFRGRAAACGQERAGPRPALFGPPAPDQREKRSASG